MHLVSYKVKPLWRCSFKSKQGFLPFFQSVSQGSGQADLKQASREDHFSAFVSGRQGGSKKGRYSVTNISG